MIITFPKVGDPTVSYRNGRPMTEKAQKMLGADQAKSAWAGTKSSLATMKAKTSTAVKATGIAAGNIARPFTLPAQNLARFLPGNAALTDPNLEARITEEAAIQSRQQALDKASASNRLNSIDIPTR